jgi:hypothetical protein
MPRSVTSSHISSFIRPPTHSSSLLMACPSPLLLLPLPPPAVARLLALQSLPPRIAHELSALASHTLASFLLDAASAASAARDIVAGAYMITSSSAPFAHTFQLSPLTPQESFPPPQLSSPPSKTYNGVWFHIMIYILPSSSIFRA